MSFSSLGLGAELCRAVSEKGYGEPTPVQSQAIPVILEGRDVMAGAQTGTGKTAGFTLPLLQRLVANPVQRSRRIPRVLILTPTRELAAQVGQSVVAYGKYLSLRSAVVFGGVGMQPQVDALRRGVDVLVATPGRLLDHVGRRTVDLSGVEILVLDEADRMLDMGFIHDIRRVLGLLPPRRQNLLFSATFADEIKRLANDLLHDPVQIEVARRNAPAELVSQVVHPVDRERKRELLASLISSKNWRQVLVFTRTKHGANRLSEQLERDGITAAAIHGNKSQGARTKALADFKRGKVRVLVATDIAARGLDINQLPHVVNYELPNVAEDYVHRIGRTGRAGNEGEAASLVCVDEHRLLRDIERVLGREISRVMVPGFEPDPSIRPEPIPNGRGGRNVRGARPDRGARGARPSRGRGPRPAQGRVATDRPSRSMREPGPDRQPGGDVDGNRAGVETHANRPVFGEQQRRKRRPGQPNQSRSTADRRPGSGDRQRNARRASGPGGKQRSSKRRDDVCALLGG